MAIPFYIDIGVMFYRTDVFKNFSNYQALKSRLTESITWDEFINLKQRLDPRTKSFYVFPGEDYEGLVCSYIELILNQNRNFFSEKIINLNSGEAKKALHHLIDLFHSYNISPESSSEFKEISAYDYFFNDGAVFVRGWPGFEYEFKSKRDKLGLKFDIERASLPHFRGTDPASIFGGWNLMVSKYSQKKKEALEFIKFILEEKTQKIMYERGNYLPIITKIYNDSLYVRSHTNLTFYKNLLSTGVHRPFLEDYTRISDIISFYVHKAIIKEFSVDTALENATEMINSGRVIIR